MEQQFDIVMTSLRSFMSDFGSFLPKLIGAVAILIVGWLVSKLLHLAVVRGLKAVRFHKVTDRAGLDDFLKQGGVRKGTVDVLGAMVYWLAILMTLLTTFNVLGLTALSTLFHRVAEFVPNVIVAMLTLTIGLYFARFVADAVTTYTRNVGTVDADLVGRLMRWAITAFVVLLAIGQFNIPDRILEPAFLIMFGGLVLALALAFGIGGQKWAADKLDKMEKGKLGSVHNMKKAA
ncbi:MAG: mechanosensitive ion channel family protein [Sulfurifustaceae bacterium]